MRGEQYVVALFACLLPPTPHRRSGRAAIAQWRRDRPAPFSPAHCHPSSPRTQGCTGRPARAAACRCSGAAASWWCQGRHASGRARGDPRVEGRRGAVCPRGGPGRLTTTTRWWAPRPSRPMCRRPRREAVPGACAGRAANLSSNLRSSLSSHLPHLSWAGRAGARTRATRRWASARCAATAAADRRGDAP
eukprot:scaffold28961_cov65-Phaeocystis_antarctica.AAC.2